MIKLPRLSFLALLALSIVIYSTHLRAETLRMATSWSGGPPLEDCAKHFARSVELLTKGEIKIEVYPAGVLGDPLQVSETVKMGLADLGHSWSGYDWGKDRTAVLFGGYSAGFDSEPMLHWIYYGGGADLWQRWRLEKFEVIAFPICVWPTEVFLHSRKPVRTLSDLKGLKVRTTGAWVEIVKEMGASPVTVAGGDIFPMLERGAIDATEWGTLYDNIGPGFNKVAKYIILPGVHQPGAATELLINKGVWGKFSEDTKTILSAAARTVTMDYWLLHGVKDIESLESYKKAGNEIIELELEVRNKAIELGKKWADQSSEGNEWFSRVLTNQREFQESWSKLDRYRRK